MTAAVGRSIRPKEKISVARDQTFGRRFAEMAGLSLGVAGLSFLAGWILRAFLGVEV